MVFALAALPIYLDFDQNGIQTQVKEQNLALTAEKQSDPGKKLGLVDHKNLHFSFFHGLRRIELKDGKHQKLDRQAQTYERIE